MTDPVLALRRARYWYPATASPALDGVDLELGEGEVLGIVGPNDAGKTTLCLVAAGLAPQAIAGRLEGEVRLSGTPTVQLRPFELAQRVGILFQNATTQLSATAPTVWEEVAFGPRNLGLPIDEVAERVNASLAVLRLGPIAARDPQRLSGGQAQLIALASMLALRPRCLVLDEPTSQLDPVGTRLVGDALSRLAGDTGTAILLVEHKTDLVLATAGRVALIERGRVSTVGPARDVLGDARLPAVGVEAPALLRLAAVLRDAGRSPDVLGGLGGAADADLSVAG